MILTWVLSGLLLIAPGCGSALYDRMNAAERDAWQHPQQVIDALSPASGSRVADLGAGGGYFTFRLLEAVGPNGVVYAVDTDKASLDYIEQQAVRQGGLPANLTLVLAAPNDPRLPERSMDLIFTCNTYHHLPDRIAYFTALRRTLRDDGRVAVIDYKEGGWFGSLFGHATPKETVRRELEAAGYRLLRDVEFLPRQHFQIFAVARP